MPMASASNWKTADRVARSAPSLGIMLNGLHRREAPSERPFKLRHEVIGVGDAGGYGEFGTFEWHCQSSRTLSLGDSDTPPATVQALELTAPGG